MQQGASELGPVLQPVVNDPIAFDDAIQELRHFSLVRRYPDARLLTLHRLVQAVLKDSLDVSIQEQWARRVVRLVVTRLGERRLEELTALHLEELRRLTPRLRALWTDLESEVP